MTGAHPSERWKGVILVLLSGIAMSTKAILAKLAYRHGVDALSVLSLRMFFAVPFLALSVCWAERNTDRRITRTESLAIILCGFVGYYVSTMLDFKGLELISASLERMVLFLYPTFVVFLSALLFRKKLSRLRIAALLLTYAGMGIVFHHERNLSSAGVWKGSLLVLGCSIGYATYLVGAGRLIPKVGATRFNGYSLLAGTAFLFGHWVVFGRSLLGLPWIVYGYGVLIATLGTVIPTVLLSFGIAYTGAATAAILTTVGPVSTILLANLILGEPVSWLQGLGILLVLSGVTVISVRR